jgi:hypothetical protein
MIFWRGMISKAREHNLPDPTFGPARLAYQAALEEIERETLKAA